MPSKFLRFFMPNKSCSLYTKNKERGNSDGITLNWDKGYRWYKQEGQHPLTGQRAANFRLLANR